MAYMNVSMTVAAMGVVMGSATKVRVRSLDNGQVQVRPTDRVSDKNLPKGEQLRTVGLKGNSGRFGLPSAFTDNLVAGKVGFAKAKHGWFTIVTADNDQSVGQGSVSAK